MPRAGLSNTEVIRAGADLADEVGYGNLAMAPLAQRLGVRTPSLYKHVAGLADLQRGIAVLAMNELDRATRDAMHGLSGTAALEAFARAFRDYAVGHPGRYTATIGAGYHGDDDPMLEPAARMVDSITVVLRGYGIADDEMDHAMRTLRSMIHGFAALQMSDGFQWSGDPEISFEWMIRFLDEGLRHHTLGR